MAKRDPSPLLTIFLGVALLAVALVLFYSINFVLGGESTNQNFIQNRQTIQNYQISQTENKGLENLTQEVSEGISNKELSQEESERSGEKNKEEKVNVSFEDPALGNPNAPVKLIEFSDVTCHFCRGFHKNVLPLIKKNYIDKGKVYFVYKDYIRPSFREISTKSAEAIHCAMEQGKEWEMLDKIINEVDRLTLIRYSTEDLKRWAGEIGLDKEKFDSCLDSGKYYQEVQDDMREAKEKGVSVTPVFFINNKKLVGLFPYEVFEEAINEELNK